MNDIPPPDFEYNFPEILARDLELSGSAFTSRSMTAGAPSSAALAVAELTLDDSSLAKPILIPFPFAADMKSEATMVYHKLLASVPSFSSIEDDDWDADSPTGSSSDRSRTLMMMGEGRESGVHQINENGVEPEEEVVTGSDSASELSLLVGLEPLALIRTRQESVTTAATSVSGEHSPFSCAGAAATSDTAATDCTAATSSSTSSSTETASMPPTPTDRVRQGSWVDLDLEPEADKLDQTNSSFDLISENHKFLPADDRIFFRPRSQSTPSCRLSFAEMTLESDPLATASPSDRNAAIYRPFHLPSQSLTGLAADRPSTSGGLFSMEKARIVNIPHSPTYSQTNSVPRRRLSVRKLDHTPCSSISATPQVAFLVQLPNSSASAIEAQENLPSPRPRLEEMGSGDSSASVRTPTPRTTLPPQAENSTTPVVEMTPRPYADPAPASTPPPPYRQEPQIRQIRTAVSSLTNVLLDPEDESSRSDAVNSHSSSNYTTEKLKSSWRASSTNLLTNMTTRQSSPQSHTEKEASFLEKKFGIPRSPSVKTRQGPPRPNAPGIPLPPEVVETLRISIACFPETMLLSTSLSVETIRAYSKKLKHTRPHTIVEEASRSVFSLIDQAAQNDTGAGDSNKSGRRWNLSRLRSPWRVQQLQSPSSPSSTTSPYGPVHRHYQSQTRHYKEEAEANYAHHSLERSPSSASSPTAAKPVWQAVKNIFPRGSNYICDALYAHLVAYNYVGDLCAALPSPANAFAPRLSSLVHTTAPGAAVPSASPVRPRASTPSLPEAATSASRTSMDDTRRIPKKAASLLGLSDMAAVEQSVRASTISRQKLTKQKQPEDSAERPAWGRKGSAATSGAGGHASEQTLRELHTGLARCVLRLIATLQSPAGRPGTPRRDHGFPDEAETEYDVVPHKEVSSAGDAESRADVVRDISEPHAVDPMLMRALVEVVRANEESAV